MTKILSFCVLLSLIGITTTTLSGSQSRNGKDRGHTESIQNRFIGAWRLAWLLAQKPWIVPIPVTTTLPRLEENIGAVAVELGPEDLRELETAASRIALQGARYPEELQKLVGR